MHASKISQVVGDYDRERSQPTLNQTWTRYQLAATDLGVPFRHKDRTYVLFGDTHGARGGDAIGYSTDTDIDRGLHLEFIRDATGIYKPIQIPGITQGEFEVPVEGVSIGGRMYVYHTTDADNGTRPAPNPGYKMGRSVVAVSDDDGQTFTLLYSLSRQYFINVSIVATDAGLWPGLPYANGEQLVMFGSGVYRRSNVYLAAQPAAEIGARTSMRYWSGLDGSGKPVWSLQEQAARPLFNQPCVGEFSVSYNRFIDKWIMLYNCDFAQTRGINLRTADQPWGPWSEPVILFRPWEDNGYCHFMHVNWAFQKCDQVQDAGRDNEWGGEYGPYQFRDLAVGNASSTTIYFNMSTWNPYTVVLMRATLQLEPK